MRFSPVTWLFGFALLESVSGMKWKSKSLHQHTFIHVVRKVFVIWSYSLRCRLENREEGSTGWNNWFRFDFNFLNYFSYSTHSLSTDLPKAYELLKDSYTPSETRLHITKKEGLCALEGQLFRAFIIALKYSAAWSKDLERIQR